MNEVFQVHENMPDLITEYNKKNEELKSRHGKTQLKKFLPKFGRQLYNTTGGVLLVFFNMIAR
jgi:hypothetical protein